MFEPLFLWVTRSAPYNALTARRLRSIGQSVLRTPVLAIEGCAATAPLVGRPDAIAFTSANGVDHHHFRSEWAALPVFAVGDHSAETALKAGYLDVRSAKGDLGDLQRLIATSFPRPAHIVHFSAEEPAGNLCAYLEMSGYEATRQVVYRSSPVPDSDLERAIAALPLLDGILVHSPKAARRIAELLAAHPWSGSIFCISAACAAAFRDLPGLEIKVAARPTEQSLIHLVGLARRHRSALASPRLAEAGVLVANDNPGWPSPPTAA